MKKPDRCPHCGETGIDYRNYKRHLYMYCVDPLLIIDAWDDIKDDKPILKSEEDAKLFFESIDNPKPPNDKLKEVAKKYKGETSFKDPVKSEPTENPGFIRRILNWFKK